MNYNGLFKTSVVAMLAVLAGINIILSIDMGVRRLFFQGRAKFFQNSINNSNNWKEKT